MKNLLSTSKTTIKVSSRLVVDGLEQPLYVTAPAKDGDAKGRLRERLFILEQKSGAVKILDLKTEKVLPEPFLTIPSDDLLKDGFEQGLLGLAFHPNYAENGKFYVSYTAVRYISLTHVRNLIVIFLNSPDSWLLSPDNLHHARCPALSPQRSVRRVMYGRKTQVFS